MRLMRMAPALLALSLLAGSLACSKSSSTPPVEKIENIQNFNATNSESGSSVSGTHQYSTNGASGALGTPVSAGFTTKDVPVNCDITVNGNGVIPRIYQSVKIYGTQTRTDTLSGNGRYDPQNWINEMLGANETYKYPSIELKFYDYKGWVIPQSFRNAILAEFQKFVSGNPYVTSVRVTDGGVYPGTYVAQDGVIAIVPTDETSSASNDLDDSLKSGTIAINPGFSSITLGNISGECKDLAGGPKNQLGASLHWNTIKMGSIAYAERRNNFEVKLLNGVPTEYQTDFSGSTTQSNTVYSSLQSMPGQGSLLGGDDDVPDGEKMVVGRRYGETPRMDDKLKKQREKNR